MGTDSGYIKLYRKVIDNPVVMKDADHLAAWVWLLGKAEWKSKDMMFQGKRITLHAGQGMMTYTEISSELKVNITKCRRILETFKNEHQIELQSSNKNTVFTIVRWDDYQQNEQQDEQQVNNNRTTSELPTYYIRKEEGEEYKNTTRARASDAEVVPLRSVIPPTLDMVREYCLSRGNTIDPEEFMDWYEARDWMTGKTRMKDWQATVRGWERRRKQEQKEQTQTGGRLDWIDEL